MSNSCLMPVSVYVSFSHTHRRRLAAWGELRCQAVSVPDCVAKALSGHASSYPQPALCQAKGVALLEEDKESRREL